ncbi:MAG: DNA primase [Gammaproteobacteria bacterium]|nr:DNA primase [Gammaproteobacteria bacterium]
MLAPKEKAAHVGQREAASNTYAFAILSRLLDRLQGVKRTGAGRWIARCPAHEDRHPSLAIRELEDGRVLLHCFAGCDVHQIVSAVGLSLADLFPPRAIDHARPERIPFPAADVLRAVAFEALLCAVAAADMAKGKTLSDAERERLIKAAARLQEAARLGGAA